MCAKVRPIIPRRRHTKVALTSGRDHPVRPRPCKHGDFGRSREAQTGDDTAWPVARGGGHETETSSAPMFNGFWHVTREMKRRCNVCKPDVMHTSRGDARWPRSGSCPPGVQSGAFIGSAGSRIPDDSYFVCTVLAAQGPSRPTERAGKRGSVASTSSRGLDWHKPTRGCFCVTPES